MPADKLDSKALLAATIAELSQRAAVAGLAAWAQVRQEGRIGNYELPVDHPAAMQLVERGFKLGYSLALLDYVMDAVGKLRKLGDAAVKDGIEELRKGLESKLVH